MIFKFTGFSMRMGLSAMVGALLALAFGVYMVSEEDLERANDTRYRAFLVADELRQSTEDLTRMVRTYVVTGNPHYKMHFHEIVDIREGRTPRPADYRSTYWDVAVPDLEHVQAMPLPPASLLTLISATGLTDSERLQLEQAKRLSDDLSVVEQRAIDQFDNAVDEHDRQLAIEMVHGLDYQIQKTAVMQMIRQFEETIEQRHEQELTHAEQVAGVARFIFIGAGMLFVYLLWTVQQGILRVLGASPDRIKQVVQSIGRREFMAAPDAILSDRGTVLNWLYETQTSLKVAEDAREYALEELRQSREVLNQAQIVGEIGSWQLALDTLALHWSDQTYRIFGMKVGEPISLRRFYSMVDPQDRDHVKRAWAQAVAAGGVGYDVEHRIFTRYGTRWVRERARIEFDAEGRPHRGVGTIQDVTERRTMLDRLRLAAGVFTHAREGIVITDRHAVIVDVNAAFSEITGYSRDEVVGQRTSLLKSGRQSAAFYASMWSTLVANGHWDGEVWNKSKSGEIYPQLLTISAIYDERGEASQYVALYYDITEQKKQQTQLERSAHYDPVTGLPNRVMLAREMARLMKEARETGSKLLVAYLDLDGFKQINDSHGHAVGDKVLQMVSAQMRDTLDHHELLARLGGDEFVVVFHHMTPSATGHERVEELLRAVDREFVVENLKLRVTVSIGLTEYPQPDVVDADQLLRQADQAMYGAKLAGRNRFHLFDAAQDRQRRRHHLTLERLSLAFQNQEFLLMYQPKVDMRRRQVLGVEALIRWNHPEKGLLLPAQFLEEVQGQPLEVLLGEWVIDTALKQQQLWREQGLDMSVSVNVSADHLEQPSFVERLQAILTQHAEPHPARLELEVLESSAFQEVGKLADVIRACKRLGVRFALDDFGTGYSTLTYLQRLPIDVLKIDQSFVRSMLDDEDSHAIVEGVLGLARAFHREVVAEGVETEAHLRELLALGCDVGQGFGLARPMPGADLPAWVKAWSGVPAKKGELVT